MNVRVFTPYEKARVRLAVGIAVREGRLTRPHRCSKCNDRPVTRDGREPIHAHHDDYSKPLDVIWLCPTCHMARHRELGWGSGSETTKRIRTGRTIQQIRRIERARAERRWRAETAFRK